MKNIVVRLVLASIGALSGVLFAVSLSAATPQREVGAVEFLLAFRDGKADRFKGYTIKGVGVNFHAQTTREGKVALILTVAELKPDGSTAPLKTLRDWAKAEMNEKTLVLFLTGADLRRKEELPKQDPPSYEFRGRWTGDTSSVPRMISAAGGAAPPMYSIPLLSDGEAK